MGRWMIELFSLKQLDAMEQKDYDLLRNIVLRELESSSQIRRILVAKNGVLRKRDGQGVAADA